MQWTDAGVKTFTAGEAIEQYRRVKLSGDFTVVKCVAGEDGIGVTFAAVASGALVGVIMLNKAGTCPMVASGAISQNAQVFPSADGKITATVTGRATGFALEAATADGDVIEILPLPYDLFNQTAGKFGFHDDFEWFVTAHRWTAVLTDSGTASVGDAAGGIVTLVCSDGTVADNDEAYLPTTNEIFLFAANKPIWFEARVKWTEAASNAANIIAGFADVFGANTLLDNGGGPPASYSGAVFYKIDGENVWRAEVSIGGTQTAVTLTGMANGGSGTYQKLGIIWVPTSSTAGTAYFYCDGVLVGSQAFTFTGATEMKAGIGQKNGSANNENLLCDYITAYQVR